jgi:hypothetical protein
MKIGSLPFGWRITELSRSDEVISRLSLFGADQVDLCLYLDEAGRAESAICAPPRAVGSGSRMG